MTPDSELERLFPEPPRPEKPTKQSPFRNWQPGWLKPYPVKNPKLPAKI